jgi:AcrR family transcriptional regulator
LPEAEISIHPRKLEITHAAVTCFLEHGYHQTGVRDIAKQAGISLGNLYNHFQGKDAVLAFIAELEGKELLAFIELLSNPDDLRAALEQFIDHYAAYAARPENALLGVEILTEALRNPDIAEVFGKNRNRLIDALASCLTEGAKSGIFVPYDDPRAVACMVLDALEGLGLRGLSTSKPSEHAIRSIRSLIINGLEA